MKKLRILGFALAIIALSINFSLNKKTERMSNLYLGTLIFKNEANAEVGLPCDTDPNDSCWNPETGQQYSDCDPSFWFHSCEG